METAAAGDRVRIHSKTVGVNERLGTIIEVHGNEGAPPYFVRFDDGHESLVYPGADLVVEPAQ